MMRLTFSILLAISIALVGSLSSNAKQEQSDSKIGIINVQKVVMESKAGKEAREAFERDLGNKRAVLRVKEEDLKKLEAALKEQAVKLTPEERRKKEEEFAQGLKELQRLKQDLEDELKKKDRDLSSSMLKEIFEVTQKVGQEKQFTIILQSGPQIIYRDKTIDITDEVLKRYDSLHSKR